MQQMHSLAWQLRPASLDTFGVEPALLQNVQEWSQQSGIQAEFVTLGLPTDKRVAIEIETALYCVVQEALTNVQRHSGACHVSVLLECQSNTAQVIVEDDGDGFDFEPVKQTQRLGLLSMHQRMELVGGALAIESIPGQGTTVYARVPVPTS